MLFLSIRTGSAHCGNYRKIFLAEHPDAFDAVMWVLFDENTKAAYDNEVYA